MAICMAMKSSYYMPSMSKPTSAEPRQTRRMPMRSSWRTAIAVCTEYRSNRKNYKRSRDCTGKEATSRSARFLSYNSRSSATGGLETTLRQLNTPRPPISTMPSPVPRGQIQGEGL